MSILIILALIGFILLDIIAYFGYLLGHPEKAEALYESNTFFVMMTGIHKFCSRCRKVLRRKPFISPDDYNSYRTRIGKLASREDFTNSELHHLLHGVLGDMVGAAEGFDDDTFFKKVKGARISPFMKILVIGFYRKTSILLTQQFVPFEEKQAFIAEIKYLLLELSRL